MSEMEETEDELKQKIKLSAAIRNKHFKEALKLLQEGAGVDYKDQTGSYPLHHAASAGYDDLIEILLEKGANVMAWDNNGRTALHKAAMHGHVRAMVILIASGGVVRTLDRKGCLALEYAIQNKHLAVVELLCQFGSEPLLQDWSWLEQDNLKKRKTEYTIKKIIDNQIRMIPGYRHSGIIFDVKRIGPEEGPVVPLENTGVEVIIQENQARYYLYLCQTEEAYGSSPPLGEEEESFGYLLKCQTWGGKVEKITLRVNVDRVLREREDIVLRPATKNSCINNIEVQEVDGVGITIVTMTIPLKPNETTYFAMTRKEKKEVFQISDEAVTLTPESEPEAEIDIPAGTFNSCELLVKFVDTTEDPDEPEEVEKEKKDKPEEETILLTSILDLSTNDGQQPNNEIEMKIPVTAKDQSEGVVVLTTSKPDPNLEEWMWDALSAEIDEAGKAVFKISHFSIYTGASKSSFDANPEAVKKTVRKTFLRMRKVEFLVAVKTPELDETKTDMIIICGTKRKNKSTRTKYDKNYSWFNVGGKENELEVPEGQIFQIEIRGNLKERTDDDNMKLTFKGNDQESYRALEIVSTSPGSVELAGEVEIYKETKCLLPDIVETVDMESCSCYCGKVCPKQTTVEPMNWETKTVKLCSVAFNTTLQKRAPEPHPADYPLSGVTHAYQSMSPPTVTFDKLKDAVYMLPADEAKQLGFQLGLDESLMSQILEDTMEEKDLAKNIFRKWHLLLAKYDMVKQLKEAMEAIGHRDIT